LAAKPHRYKARVVWTGNIGAGAKTYEAYGRDHQIQASGKPDIPGSSDPSFRGDPGRWNPEELLVASLSTCHQLWYLHHCSVAGVVVTAYQDDAEGEMAEDEDGSGRFTAVTLRPRATLAPGSDPLRAEALHHEAHRMCFIANSVNFPVRVEPTFERESAP
jgi:organic hydroperoxide reductase OsmC/OhrA